MQTYVKDAKLQATATADDNFTMFQGEPGEGYLLDARRSGVEESSSLKVAKDDHTILIPQPTNDPNDPLNWAFAKKHLTLAIISFISFLPDFGASTGIPAFLPQSEYWHISPSTTQKSLVGCLVTLGVGGLVFVAFAAYFGRLPTLLFFQLVTFASGIWCATETNFDSYSSARTLYGFFATTGLSGGLIWIQDMFFFHEHPRKINIWSGAVIVSPYVGPLVSSLIIWHATWRWGFWTLTILNGIGLILIVLFLDETLYSREAHSGGLVRNSRLARVAGIEQWKNRHTRSTFLQAMMRPCVTFLKIPVALIVVYYFLNFAWVIGVNVTVVIWLEEFYGFGPRENAIFYIGGIVGSVIGWFIGHWLHDYVGAWYASRHGGKILPEARLFVCYVAGVLLVVSEIIIGLALARHWHYMVLAVFFTVQIVGIMICTVGAEAYLLDAYPEASGEVGAWLNLGRAMGGVVSTYVQIEWAEKVGADVCFGIEAGIAAASLGLLITLQAYGPQIRRRQGPIIFKSERSGSGH
ncbi:MAG: hypothetical protein M1831_005461 [Alyxoria varia]|nr:MAG: hypothetical protein M1831_005461 [Alyxoria varia]